LNVALNAIIGAIPVFGDIFSIWFRSNVKNAQLLERYVSVEAPSSTFGNWIFVIAVIFGIILLLTGILVATVWLIRRVWNAV
jgi:heme/copper-type cytochrome/quinol oxidase subunit 2